MSDACTCDKERELRGIIVLNGVTRARFEELKRDLEMALESKSFEDGLLILHEVPEVLYIPVGGKNDQASD